MKVTNPNILMEENSSGLSSIKINGNEVEIKLKNSATLIVLTKITEDGALEHDLNYISAKKQKSIERKRAKIMELQKEIEEEILDENEILDGNDFANLDSVTDLII